jgi:hypothetical protein
MDMEMEKEIKLGFIKNIKLKLIDLLTNAGSTIQVKSERYENRLSFMAKCWYSMICPGLVSKVKSRFKIRGINKR